MLNFGRLALGTGLALGLGWTAPAHAETPANTLVMARQIDDMISLDPAEVFEFTAAEWAANVYDRLITYPVDDVENIQGHVAESWQISDDGRTFTFKVRDGISFHSGNPLTAEDAAWSLQRVVKLNKTPAFILTQFGFTPENVEQKIQAVDDRTFTVELDQPYAPTFFLYCLTATVASVVTRPRHGEREGRRSRLRMAQVQLRRVRPVQARVLEAERERGAREERRLLKGRGRLRSRDHAPHRRTRDPAAAPREGRHRHRAQP